LSAERTGQSIVEEAGGPAANASPQANTLKAFSQISFRTGRGRTHGPAIVAEDVGSMIHPLDCTMVQEFNPAQNHTKPVRSHPHGTGFLKPSLRPSSPRHLRKTKKESKALQNKATKSNRINKSTRKGQNKAKQSEKSQRANRNKSFGITHLPLTVALCNRFKARLVLARDDWMTGTSELQRPALYKP
jgi:hypothetical protein